jgi:hypothetical protein
LQNMKPWCIFLACPHSVPSDSSWHTDAVFRNTCTLANTVPCITFATWNMKHRIFFANYLHGRHFFTIYLPAHNVCRCVPLVI